MKAIIRIISVAIVFAFIASTVIQYHHHDEDGGICLRIHTDFCSQENGPSLDDNILHISKAHHTCSDEECSLKLDASDNTSVSNYTHSLHGNYIIASFILITQLALPKAHTNKTKWTIPPVLGHIIDACVSGLSLRAPPCL